METKKNEVKDGIPYQFTANPLNLMFILDSDCLKILNLLIQEESYWKSKGKLVDNYFFKSINDLKDDMFMSNDQDVRLTLEALYINELIDIIPQGEQHKASQFKLNLEKINEIDKLSITEVKKFFPRICKLRRGTKCTYVDRVDVGSIEQGVHKLSTNCTLTSTPKLDNIDKSNKIDNKDKIENNITINDNIKVEVEIEKAGNNPNLFSKSLIDDSNGKQVKDTSATKAAAQTIEQTKGNVINEDKLLKKITQDYERLDRKDFYTNLCSYSTAELKDLQNKKPTLPMSMNDNEKGLIVYHSTVALRKKEAS
jgi:hypothetical protein